MRNFAAIAIALAVLPVLTPVELAGAEHTLLNFQRQKLTGTYFSEGANAGDINHDGVMDVVYGPYWFAGPDFQKKQEIYKAVPQNMDGYADNFFNWVFDFNGDGWSDVFVVGFPGTPAYVYENPKAAGFSNVWKKHEVFDWVSNESPHFTNLVGDEWPEVICTRDGFYGFVTINRDDPLGKWDFHPVSEQVTDGKFGHGLGVGDVNGDGRLDIIHRNGWYEQPATAADTSRWPPHEAAFSDSYGGAEMYAYDVDGDGDNDVITSLAAHDFGLAWYEQVVDGNTRSFRQHLIMGTHPAENRYGVLFSELHSVQLADMDGDGLKDIVTGKTYYSHHKQSPLWDAGAVVYWFKLHRTQEGVDWIPYRADDQAGIGRQISVCDLNADGQLDLVVGGMLGAHALIQTRTDVDQETWKAAQPKRYDGPAPPSVEGAEQRRGPKAELDADTVRAVNALEGEKIPYQLSAGNAGAQDMKAFGGDRWSGNAQLFWTGARPGETMTIELPEADGTVTLELVLTCARDYAIVQLSLDGEQLGPPIDCFQPEVATSGILKFPLENLKPGKHQLTIQIAGANPKAVPAHMVGLDFVRWTR